MLAGIIAFVFGILETFLLQKLLYSFTSGKYNKAVAFLMIKLISYAAAISLLVFLFSSQLIPAAIGFAIGFPVMTVIWFIFKNLRKEENCHETDNNN